jgi:hypothetical protein
MHPYLMLRNNIEAPFFRALSSPKTILSFCKTLLVSCILASQDNREALCLVEPREKPPKKLCQEAHNDDHH